MVDLYRVRDCSEVMIFVLISCTQFYLRLFYCYRFVVRFRVTGCGAINFVQPASVGILMSL